MGIRIALAGNPNCGKTTMFNDLTGASQYVGNWPGVTVEKKEGTYTRDKDVTVTDLPGVYSLSPYSPEEIVTRDYLLDGRPDAVINLVDATNLERNLYLTTQVLDLGLPVVVALNMMDLVEKNGDRIDVDKLSKRLGCPVVPTSALKGRGMDELMKVAIDAAKKGVPAASDLRFSSEIEEALGKIIDVLGSRVSPAVARWYAIKLLEGEQKTIDALNLPAGDLSVVAGVREALEGTMDDDAESLVTSERYDAITEVVDSALKKSTKTLNTTQKIDRVVTNRWLGIPIFVVIMTLVYYISVSTVGTVVTDWTNDGLFGDGWLYTGNDQYNEAVDEWDGQQQDIEAYMAAAADDGIDTEDAEAALKMEEPDDDADADAVAEYEEGQQALDSFKDEAAAAGVVATVETEGDDGTPVEETVDSDAFATALEAEEPDPASFGVWVPGLTPIVSDALESIGTAPWLESLIVDGILAGVGAVLGFVPQMIVLFLLLSILEACGYMARVAFIMDRIFRRFGLSGKSFIPMLISSGCGVPGVMSTKTIENEKDRRMTIMTTTMIPCGAKMPIIALVFGALAGGDLATTWWVAPLFYFLGVFAIVVSGIMLRKTKMFAGETTPFVMELPQYHIPAVKGVLLSTWERVRSFIVKAGTIIFLASIVMWFLMNLGFYDGQFGLLDTDMDDYIQYSLVAAIGNGISWIFAPLGFGNWQSTVTTISGLVAKENVVATVGILTSLGSDASETDMSMWASFGAMFAGNAPAIMAFCAFNLLCAPCIAAIGTIRRQMASAKWTWFALGYMTVFAWLVALMIYQFGTFLQGGGFTVWTGIALLVLAGLLFQLFRPMPKFDKDAGAKSLKAEKNAA